MSLLYATPMFPAQSVSRPTTGLSVISDASHSWLTEPDNNHLSVIAKPTLMSSFTFIDEPGS